MHLFLSPHPDDVVFSCGAMIDQMTRAGERVDVLTLMAAPPLPGTPSSPFSEQLLAWWQLGPHPAGGRQQEDRCAVEKLGAALRFGTLIDAPFRTSAQGDLLYGEIETLFADIHPGDPVLARLEDIVPPLTPGTTLYAPLAVGQHVDHRLVRAAVLRWMMQPPVPGVAVFFYEEYPYTASGSAAIQAARESLGIPTRAVLRPVSEAALEARIRASECYASQLPRFWPDRAAMAAAMREQAQQVGAGRLAERLWAPDGIGQSEGATNE